jgi:hypothetical protein
MCRKKLVVAVVVALVVVSCVAPSCEIRADFAFWGLVSMKFLGLSMVFSTTWTSSMMIAAVVVVVVGKSVDILVSSSSSLGLPFMSAKHDDVIRGMFDIIHAVFLSMCDTNVGFPDAMASVSYDERRSLSSLLQSSSFFKSLNGDLYSVAS